MTVDCFELRGVLFKRPNVGLLTNGLMRIKLSGYSSREIFDFYNVMVGSENFLTDNLEVKPFVGSSLEGAAIEIETIDVDEGFH